MNGRVEAIEDQPHRRVGRARHDGEPRDGALDRLDRDAQERARVDRVRLLRPVVDLCPVDLEGPLVQRPVDAELVSAREDGRVERVREHEPRRGEPRRRRPGLVQRVGVVADGRGERADRGEHQPGGRGDGEFPAEVEEPGRV